MDESSISIVAEVEEGKVEEVDNQEDLCPPEMCTNEEEHETKVEKVVENEVASNTGSRLNVLVILGEEAPDVAELNDEEDEPDARVLVGEERGKGRICIYQ